MANTQRRYTSRSNRPNKPSTNTILNALIGLVVVLIIITAGFIFLGNDEPEKAGDEDSTKDTESAETADGSQEEAEEEVDPEDQIGSEEIAEETEDSESTEEETASEEETTTEEESTTTEDSTTGGTVTSTPSDDPLVSERIVNTAWKPIGTSQTGEHTSVYSEGHVDWNEKLKAIAYTTGLSPDNTIVWRISNGGSPQKSIGVVSSKDKVEKYRVYLEWVDGEGWKPVKMETLKTLDGAY